jgi:hypothetical protein
MTTTLIGIALCVATLAQAGTRVNDPRTPAAPATVGAFIMQVATAVEGEPRTLDAAQATLRRLGAHGAFDPSTQLTEAFVVRLAADLGVAMTPTSNPGAPVSTVRSAAVAGHLGAIFEGRPPFVTDALPTACLTSVNRGACVNCCKETGAPANACAHFCQSNVPPGPSDVEPNP